MQEKTVNLNLFDLVGSAFCIDDIEGKKVFIEISKAIEENKSVILSFEKVEVYTTAFLNSTLGQLYRYYEEKTINSKLRFEGLSSGDSKRILRYTESIKLFALGNNSIKEKINSILGESGD
ncbi:MAG: STAS-like domain-containing protein [Candidatus Delongbacteria bacterium]